MIARVETKVSVPYTNNPIDGPDAFVGGKGRADTGRKAKAPIARGPVRLERPAIGTPLGLYVTR